MNKNLLITLGLISISLLVFSSSFAVTNQPTNVTSNNMMNSISLDNGSNNSIVVDGTIGSDWTDGNYTLTKGYFEGNTGITELYTTITPGGLFVGLNTTQTYESRWYIFVDVNASTGATNASDRGEYSSAINFAPGCTPDFFMVALGGVDGTSYHAFDMKGETNAWWYYASWYNAIGNQSIPTETSTSSTSTSTSTSTSLDSINDHDSSIVTQDHEQVSVVHYEFEIGMNQIMEGAVNDYTFQAGKEIRIAAVHGGPGAAGVNDASKLEQSVPMSVNMEDPVLLNNWLTLNIDSNSDSVADFDKYFPITGYLYQGWNLNGISDSSTAGISMFGEVITFDASYYLNAKGGVHVKDHPNHLDVLTLHYRVMNGSDNTWSENMTKQMIHLPYRSWTGDANWDEFSAQLDTRDYKIGDMLQYWISNPGPSAVSAPTNISIQVINL